MFQNYQFINVYIVLEENSWTTTVNKWILQKITHPKGIGGGAGEGFLEPKMKGTQAQPSIKSCILASDIKSLQHKKLETFATF